jgi:predicted GNAT family acetyltransferase
MSEPEVVREDEDAAGRYVLRSGGYEAEMTFVRLPDGVVRIDHTLVPEALAGQGIGKRLLEAALADARREGHRILPVCTYVESQFRKHPEWVDVLAVPG